MAYKEDSNSTQDDWLEKTWHVIRSFHELAELLIFIIGGAVILWHRSDETGIISVVALAFCLVANIIYSSKARTKNENEKSILSNEIDNLKEKLDEKNNIISASKSDSLTELEKAKHINKYIRMFGYLNNAFAELRKAEREETTYNNEKLFIAAFKDFCSTLNSAFHEITGKEFHVCIKVIINTGEADQVVNLSKLKNFKVKTLIRDNVVSKTSGIRAAKDSANLPHIIKHNTDYNSIIDNWTSQQAPFFCNNLIEYKGYTNTRFIEFYGSHKNDYDRAPLEEKEKNWKLLYKSCITSAIGIVRPDSRHLKGGTIIGFLCIDSNDKNVFNSEIDPIILAGCAEGIFNPLLKFLKIYKIPTNVKKNKQLTNNVSGIKN